MSDLYSVRVAARPDDQTVELDIKVVHPDAMHIPESPGFALMLLHDTASGDAPLASEVDLDTVMNSEWATENARAFIESVELVSSKNAPPPEALDDYEHGYWNNPKRWLEGRLRVRATHPAWVRHLPRAWDSAAFDPASDYEPAAPAIPGATVDVLVEADYERSEGFLPAPRLVIASEIGRDCPELIWIPRWGARAYEPSVRLEGLDITLARLHDWLGKPVMWRESNDADTHVGLITQIEDDHAKLVRISSGSRSTTHARPEHLDWIGLAAFRRGTPRLAPPLSLERLLAYANPAVEVVEIAEREVSLRVYLLAQDGSSPRLEDAANILRLLAVPARTGFGDFDGADSKLGRTLEHEMQRRDLSWDSELYPILARGFVQSFEVSAPARPREVDLDELDRSSLVEFLAGKGWPTWTVRVEVSDAAWLEHLEPAPVWTLDDEELEPAQAWDEPPYLWDPERLAADDDDDDDDGDEDQPSKSTLRRRFELPRGVTRDPAPLPADDPRAVLRDHGLYDDIAHPQARDNFESVCKLGNVEAVRAYVALGIDIERHADISGETPLIRAAEGDQPEVVRALAEAGVNLQGRDGGGDTAVMTAINWSHPGVLQALVEVGADLDAPDNYDNYPLVKALEADDDELITILLDGGASPNAGAATRDSALQWCLRERNEERLRELLAREGADVNQATRFGDTLLHLAVGHEDAAAVDALLDAGADVGKQNRWGWTALDLALASDAEAIVQRLTDAEAPQTKADAIAYFKAVAEADLDGVRELLDRGLDVDTRDASGTTAFIRAIAEDQRELAELLLARGADINARDADDNNALAHASGVELRRWLLESGVEAAYRDSKGVLRQPGVEAVLEGDDQELLALLLDARTNFSDLTDLSTCHLSFIWGDFEDRLDVRAQTLRTLGAAGADLEACADDGSSLLVDYINRGHEPPVMALLDVGVDIERADKHHVTPLLKSCGEYSEHEIQGRITRALLARNADYTKTEWLSRTAWDLASSVGNDECIAALVEVFERTLADALAQCGRSEPVNDEELDASVFAALARRSNLETLRHWIRNGRHEIVRGLLQAGFDPNPPQLDDHGLRPENLPLAIAIDQGDQAMLDVLLDGGADPNLCESYGTTALSHAVDEQNLAMVRRLLAAGANPEPLDDWGSSPMSTAAAKGNLELMELLHQAGARVQPRESGQAPLHAAVRNGQFEATQWLLARGASIDIRQSGRVTALHLAIDNDEVELALALLAAGADPNVVTSDEDKTTPLIRATKKGDVELITALLAAGADPRVADAQGQSAIDHASYREELRALFPESGAAPSFEQVERELPPLLRAIHLGDREAFAEALTLAELERGNYRGDTALMLAVSFGQRHMVEALIAAGADVHAHNVKGDTAWSYAFSGGQEPLRILLEGHGVATSMDGLNQMAAQSLRRDAAIAAIEAGDLASVAKQIDELDFDVDWLGRGRRPLQVAIDRGDAALIQLLLAKGADASLPASDGASLREHGEAAGFGALFD